MTTYISQNVIRKKKHVLVLMDNGKAAIVFSVTFWSIKMVYTFVFCKKYMELQPNKTPLAIMHCLHSFYTEKSVYLLVILVIHAKY